MTSDPSEPHVPESLPVQQYPYAPGSNSVKTRSVGTTIGVVVACVLGFVGLFVVAFAVIFVVSLNSYASNK